MLKKASKPKEVPVDKLKWQCQQDIFNFKTTDELKEKLSIIGQRRAVNALQLGLNIESPGYNIFVTGLVGTGRKTAVKQLIEKTERINKIPDDKIYVYNFKQADVPKLIRLPAGKGKVFKEKMEKLVNYLIDNMALIFESEEYQRKKKRIIEEYQAKQRELISRFENEVNREGFTMVQVRIGQFVKPEIVPVINSQATSFQDLSVLVEKNEFPKEKFEELKKKSIELSERFEEIFEELRGIEKKVAERLKLLDNETIAPVIEHEIAEIRESVKNEQVDKYLDEVKNHILNNLDKFRKKNSAEDEQSSSAPQEFQDIDPFLEYRVNLLIDNSDAKKAPVIFEQSPTYKNLFGTIEVISSDNGRWQTDFTRIKAGSLLKADGGFLIIEALDALTEPGVWQTLKRTLKNQKVIIQDYAPFYLISVTTLKPEPIECDVKVIMIGDPHLYQLLYNYDEDFKKIFKIRADFDSVMEITPETIMEYAYFIKKISTQEKLRPFDKSAVAGVVEYGARIAERQNKLSTEFNNIADILREANYWAAKDNSKVVSLKHIEKAIEEKYERSRLLEEKIQELIENKTIMIDTEGFVIGQVNGLSVLDTGEYSFGIPSRITAKTSVGSSGIIDIEREVKLSGKIHSKGVLILSGYLRSKYAQNKPLVMSASICFEQSYSAVDGDSASSTEIYALLSSLSELPINQGIAVTGSVNQKGEIQAVGGINQKIEGFFKVCKLKGLTGKQGVIIPEQNVGDLRLNKEVIEAVRNGMFHIYPVKTIDQGIEILTGVKAGVLGKNGRYEKGTVNYLVDKKLEELAKKWSRFRSGKGDVY